MKWRRIVMAGAISIGVAACLGSCRNDEELDKAAAQAKIQVNKVIPVNSAGTRAFRLPIRLACISMDNNKLSVRS